MWNNLSKKLCVNPNIDTFKSELKILLFKRYQEEEYCKTLLLCRHFSNFVCMDVVTGGRDCPINSNKHTLQLTWAYPYNSY
jgi:hypothetical protein